MWYKAEYTERPLDVDTKSSATVAYVRKDIIHVDGTEVKDARWECMEQTVPQEDWELYALLMEQKSEVSDIEDALMELAEMIGG